MATVAGIRFRKAGKVYYFDPTDVWPNPGDPVIVETVRGVEMGETVTGAREIPDESLTAPLKKIIRMATPEDVKRSEECIAKEKDAVEICMRKIAAHKLDMKLVDAEYTFDGSKLIFLLVEKIRGRRIPPEKESIVVLIGFGLLLLLMALVMYQDIVRLFK